MNNFKKIYFYLRKLLLYAFFYLFHLKEKKIELKKIKKILLVTDFRLGDTILSMPFIKSLKDSFPDGKIYVFCNSYSSDVFRLIKEIDEIFIYSNSKRITSIIKNLLKISRLKIDLAIDPICDYPLKTAIWTFLSGANYRIGYEFYGKEIFYTQKIKNIQKTIHICEEMLNVLRGINIKITTTFPKINISKKEFNNADIINLNNNKNVKIAIHPGGFYSTQCWAKENFAETARKAQEEFGAQIILIGSQKEFLLLDFISKQINNKCLKLISPPIEKIATILSLVNCLICNNSGILHLASALGIPTVSTMGPTVAERWWPCGENNIVIRKKIPCIGCNSGKCRIKTHDCMKLISVEEVYSALKTQILKGK